MQFPVEKNSTLPSASSSRNLQLASTASMLSLFAGAVLAVSWNAILGISIALIALVAFVLTRLALKGSQTNTAVADPIKTLKQDLARAQYWDHVESRAHELYQQFESAQDRFQNFHQILNSKFEKSEVTYGRYFSLAEQAYFALLDNCRNLLSSLKQMSQIDCKALIHRRDQLSTENLTAAQAAEMEVLKQQLQVYDSALESFSQGLVFNQKALTAFDLLTAKLGEIRSKDQLTSFEGESLLNELKELANRAQLYNRK